MLPRRAVLPSEARRQRLRPNSLRRAKARHSVPPTRPLLNDADLARVRTHTGSHLGPTIQPPLNGPPTKPVPDGVEGGVQALLPRVWPWGIAVEQVWLVT